MLVSCTDKLILLPFGATALKVVNSHRYQLYIGGPVRISAVDNLLCIHCHDSKVKKGVGLSTTAIDHISAEACMVMHCLSGVDVL